MAQPLSRLTLNHPIQDVPRTTLSNTSPGNTTTTPPDADATPPELMAVGKLVAAQGLQGELRVLPMSDFPQRFTRPGRRWLQGRSPQQQPRVVELLRGRQLPGRELFVVQLAGVNSREAAEALVGQELLVAADDRPPLQPGEFHLLDLVGLEARLLESDGSPGELIGRVRDLLHAGNDLLEIERPGEPAPAPLLIPFVQAIVPVVKLKEGWIGLTPPPGLLDL
jgi:16S rRNA processing protein RimM